LKGLTQVNAAGNRAGDTAAMSVLKAINNMPPDAQTWSPFSADTPLPLRTTDFEAGLARLFHDAVRGAPVVDILAHLCRQLSRLLRLRLAVVSRRLDTGAIVMEATSAENGLWLELQRIPQRWDSGLSSHGPGGEALRAQAAVHMRLADEGFQLWRAAAANEHVKEILALPVAAADGQRVLELYFDAAIPRGATIATLSVGRFMHALEIFLADLRIIERNRLLADALASSGNAALVTDLEGTIVWSNAAFTALSGYSADEVLGRNPNMLRSGQQGVRYYRDLWGTIRAGKVWQGETVDCGKDGAAYTIHQTVSPVAQDGRITHYLSVQHDIGRQKKERIQLELASRLSPQTGLLTPAAFENAIRVALAEPNAGATTLVVVSLRGAQRAGPALGDGAEDTLAVGLGRRIREAIAAPDLAGALGPFEYVLLLRGDTKQSLQVRLQALAEKLVEPLPYLGPVPELDIHFGTAAFPDEGANFQQLWLRADRRLADEPYRRARRNAPH
jgi:PAS domain S-box-containing protein